MAAEARGWHISGRVQGVSFRDATRRQALALGLQGYAINLADGRVEVAAAGKFESLDQLQSWLQQGPPLARVDRVEVFQVDRDALTPTGFATG
jgi:acylphosphatase